MTRYRVIHECNDLGECFTTGEYVYEYFGNTIGCIEEGMMAVSRTQEHGTFYEIPKKYLEYAPEESLVK